MSAAVSCIAFDFQCSLGKDVAEKFIKTHLIIVLVVKMFIFIQEICQLTNKSM